MKFKLAILLSLILIMLLSCEGVNPFYGNVFEDADAYELDVDLESASDTELLDAYDVGGEDVISEIDYGPEYVHVRDTLRDTYTDTSVNKSKRIDAVNMGADVALGVTKADDVVKAVNDLATDPDSVDTSSTSSIIKSLFDQNDPPEVIALQIQGFLDAVDPLENMGLLYESIGGFPPDSDPGVRGSQAYSSMLVQDMYNETVADNPGLTEAEALLTLATHFSDPDNVPEPFNRDYGFLDFPDGTTDAEMTTVLETEFGQPGLVYLVIESGMGSTLTSF